MVGSYEHNLMCLSVILGGASEAVFQRIFHFQAHALSIKSIDIAKRYLVTGSNDEHIKIYDLQKRKELGDLLGHQGTITALKFSNEGVIDQDSTDKSGKWLLSGSEDGKIIIWRTKDWEMFGTLKGHQGQVNDIAIHPSGRVAISVSEDQTIRLWNLMTVKKAAVLKIKGRDHLGEKGEFVRWSLDGNYFIVGLLNQILVYKTSTAKIVFKMKFPSTLMSLKVLKVNNKEYVVTGLGNGLIQFYDYEEQILKSTLEDEKVWEAKAEVVEPEFQLRGHTNRIKDLSYYNHPIETNGTPYLVSVGSDSRIVIWDLSEGVKDQVAVYDTGERLNCVVTCAETVEKSSTMKRRFNSLEEMNGEEAGFSESEYETDGEEIKKIMMPKKKGKKNKNKNKVQVTLE
ncbi:WD40 repeat-like protein [Suhomyces tanzawaensis NRRL Y-17324]|uniref:WD40 repeat-like protein n=1 Tax=Suhomyces tanzawaensis NRRL Y-17324 TaxID=984487 RepID=A0A1E4SC58_9ASCO|nr:WD40 repeat-like protein [Suhomyces tanzawaensis NRRL Y-17324]ODV76972.1 WD40 repeat-like protein [Suhomyces tanzawaensis NRRL Y-17324]